MKTARILFAVALLYASAAAAQRSPVTHDMAEFCARVAGRPLLDTRAFSGRGGPGRAVLDCIITEDRRLQTCTVAEETPRNRGYAESAFRIACRYSPNESGVALPEEIIATTDEAGVARVRQPFTFNINR